MPVQVSDTHIPHRVVKAGVKVNGDFVRSREWIVARLEQIEQKKADLKKRFENVQIEEQKWRAELAKPEVQE